MLLLGNTSAFVSPAKKALGSTTAAVMPMGSSFLLQQQQQFPPALARQRKSVAPVQTMSLFGLGAPELVIILIAAAFLLGPQKLAELGKDAGKIAGELKEVPKEFQKGLKEGEEQASKALKSASVDVEKDE